MRAWNELVAGLADPVPGGVAGLALLLLLGASLVAVLWYLWPDWLPARAAGSHHAGTGRRWRWLRPRWRWPRWRGSGWRLRWRRPRWRLRWRRLRPPTGDRPDLSTDALPALASGVRELSADQLAASGRYREAVRERLRAIVRDLVERGLVDERPGWTVTELGRTASAARPAVAAPMRAASEVFSRIWYGQQPATVDDDAAMRAHAAAVRASLDSERVPA